MRQPVLGFTAVEEFVDAIVKHANGDFRVSVFCDCNKHEVLTGRMRLDGLETPGYFALALTALLQEMTAKLNEHGEKGDGDAAGNK